MSSLAAFLAAWSPSPALLAAAWAGILVIALAVVLLRRRSPAGPADRWADARLLAARGASPLEIARTTGLSRDAAGLLLYAGQAAREGSFLPLPARISGPARPGPRLALRRRGA